MTPNSNYKDKYAHLIGQDAAVKAAKRTETNKSYGFGRLQLFFNINILTNLTIANFLFFFSVPSENKRDLRTIEVVQADIQAKKKMKLSQTITSVDQQPNIEEIKSTSN